MIPFLYALVCLIWGSTWLAIKIGLEGVPPFLAAGLRFLLASSVLFAIVFLRRTRLHLIRDDKISILSCGLLSFTIPYAGCYWAEQYISSGLTAVMFSTMPLAVGALSHFWTRAEVLTGRRIAGMTMGAFGTLVLFRPREGVSPQALWAMGAVLASSWAAAANLVITKRHGRHTDVYLLNAYGMAIGAACLLAASALTEPYAGLHWSRSNVAALLYLSAFGSITAFLAYYTLVKLLEASVLSMVTLIYPVVAVVLGRVALGETISPSAAAGAAMVLAGVAIAGGLPLSRRGAIPA